MSYVSPELQAIARHKERGAKVDSFIAANGIKPPAYQVQFSHGQPSHREVIGEPPPGHPAERSYLDDGYTGLSDDGFGQQAMVNESPQKAKKPSREVLLKKGSDLTPEPIVWLWKYWLAQGKFHILAGQPGVGKTTVALAVAATITTGDKWPDGELCTAGNVLIWSGEDDPADTLLPRLMASGANREHIFFVDGTRTGDGEVRPFDPSVDLPDLERAAIAIGGVSLIIVDPVVTAVTGDSHKNTETRRGLQPLVEMASRLNAAVLGITHLSKGGAGSDPVSRVIGSIAFTALARVVLVAAKVVGEDGESKRVLMRGKSNCGPDEGGFVYQLDQSEPVPGITASSASWGEPVSGTAKELMAEPEGDTEAIEDQNDAVFMLREELTTDCWTPASQVTKTLRGHGFSQKQIRTAGKKLNILRKKGAMTEGWYWRLQPKNGRFTEDALFPEDAEDALEKRRGTFGASSQSGKSGQEGALEDAEDAQLGQTGLKSCIGLTLYSSFLVATWVK